MFNTITKAKGKSLQTIDVFIIKTIENFNKILTKFVLKFRFKPSIDYRLDISDTTFEAKKSNKSQK